MPGTQAPRSGPLRPTGRPPVTLAERGAGRAYDVGMPAVPPERQARIDEPSSVPLRAWLFPASYAVHIAEEFWSGEGFPSWASRHTGLDFDPSRFLAINGAILGVAMARCSPGLRSVSQRGSARCGELRHTQLLSGSDLGSLAVDAARRRHSGSLLAVLLAARVLRWHRGGSRRARDRHAFRDRDLLHGGRSGRVGSTATPGRRLCPDSCSRSQRLRAMPPPNPVNEPLLPMTR